MYWQNSFPMYLYFLISFIRDELFLPLIKARLFALISNLFPFLVNRDFIPSIFLLFHLFLTSNSPSRFSHPRCKEFCHLILYPFSNKKPFINYVHSNYIHHFLSPRFKWFTNIFQFVLIFIIPIKHPKWSSTTIQYAKSSENIHLIYWTSLLYTVCQAWPSRTHYFLEFCYIIYSTYFSFVGSCFAYHLNVGVSHSSLSNSLIPSFSGLSHPFSSFMHETQMTLISSKSTSSIQACFLTFIFIHAFIVGDSRLKFPQPSQTHQHPLIYLNHLPDPIQ